MTAGRSYRIQNPSLRQECEFSRTEESTTNNQSFVTITQITTWFCFSVLCSSKRGDLQTCPMTKCEVQKRKLQYYTNRMHDTASEKKKKTNIQASCDMIHDDVPKYTKYGYNRLECYIGYDTKLGNIHARPQET